MALAARWPEAAFVPSLLRAARAASEEPAAEERRAVAARALVACGGVEAVSGLAADLQSAELPVALRAARALGAANGPEAARALARALADERAPLRAELVRALARTDAPAAHDGVLEALGAFADAAPAAQARRAVAALARLGAGPALRRLSPDNSQGEYYLTDVVATLAAMGHRVGSVSAPAAETQGVNDRWQLALAERELRARTNRRWLLNGVTMLDPRQTFVDVTVTLGRDVTLYPGTILQGSTVVGDGCEIGPDTRLMDCTMSADALVEHTAGRDSEVGAGAHVGPYAFLPAGSAVVAGAVTGAFYTAPGA